MWRSGSLTVLVASGAALGCGSSSNLRDTANADPGAAPSLTFTGAQGQPIPATPYSDVLLVGLSVNGVMGTAVVDTGSPIVALDPPAFAGAHLPNGAGLVDTLTVGALTFTHPYVGGANLTMTADPAVSLGGSLGCGILCTFAVSLNYRDNEVTLGTASLPANVAAVGTNVSFTLEGGGRGAIRGVPGVVLIPKSRIPVTVTIEGHDHPLVLDTGSSLLFLRQSILSGLTNDGRGAITGVGTVAVNGQSTSTITRVRSVILAGAEVDGLVAS